MTFWFSKPLKRNDPLTESQLADFQVSKLAGYSRVAARTLGLYSLLLFVTSIGSIFAMFHYPIAVFWIVFSIGVCSIILVFVALFWLSHINYYKEWYDRYNKL